MEDQFTFTHRGLEFIAEAKPSDIPYGDINMGKWTDEIQEWAFDTKTGTLLGEHQCVTLEADTMVQLGVKMDAWLASHTEVEIESLEQITGYGDEVTGYQVEMNGYQVIARNLPEEYDRNRRRYFVEGIGNLPPTSTWGGCRPEDKLAAIEKYGSLKDACIAYACQDYRQAVEFVRGDWCYVFLRVWLSIDGEKVGQPSVGSGIESYLSEEDALAIAKEEADEVISEAEPEKLVEDAAKVAKVLYRLQAQDAKAALAAKKAQAKK